MTKRERTELAEKLHAIQATIDGLLDIIVNVDEKPKRKSSAKKTKGR
jgi:hypothetical protein